MDTATGFGHRTLMSRTFTKPETRAESRDTAKRKPPRPAKGSKQGSRAQRDERARTFDNWTVFDLKLRATQLGLQGFSDKSRAQLIDMLHTTQRVVS